MQRIEEKRPDDPEVLMEDWDLQDLLSLNLMRTVQLCVDVAAHVIASLDAPPPDTMAGAFDVLRDAGYSRTRAWRAGRSACASSSPSCRNRTRPSRSTRKVVGRAGTR